MHLILQIRNCCLLWVKFQRQHCGNHFQHWCLVSEGLQCSHAPQFQPTFSPPEYSNVFPLLSDCFFHKAVQAMPADLLFPCSSPLSPISFQVYRPKVPVSAQLHSPPQTVAQVPLFSPIISPNLASVLDSECQLQF